LKLERLFVPFKATYLPKPDRHPDVAQTLRDLVHPIGELLEKTTAITTDGQVIDVFTAAGLPTPDIGILDDRFLAEVRGLKHKNVAAELLEKLLKDELKVRSKRNLVQSQLFSDKLRKTLNAYPPDLQEEAVKTVLMQAELLCAEWV